MKLGRAPGGGVVASNGDVVQPPMNTQRLIQQLQLLQGPKGVEIVDAPYIEARMAVDLSTKGKPKLLINWKLAIDHFQSTPDEMLCGISHELGHIYENAQLRSTSEGELFYQQFQSHILGKGTDAKAYHAMYNCLRDVYVNRRTLQHMPGMTDTMRQLYATKLFPSHNLMDCPRHLQFVYALLRESMMPGEQCIVDPEVRKLVDSQASKDRFTQMIPMEDGVSIHKSLQQRLTYIQTYIEPLYTYLYQNDTKEQEKENSGDARDNSQEENPSNDGQSQDGGEQQKGAPSAGEKTGGEGETTSGKETDGTEKSDATSPSGKYTPSNDTADSDSSAKDVGKPAASSLSKLKKSLMQGMQDTIKNIADALNGKQDDAGDKSDISHAKNDTDVENTASGKTTHNDTPDDNDLPPQNPREKQGLYDRGQFTHAIEDAIDPQQLQQFMDALRDLQAKQDRVKTDAEIEAEDMIRAGYDIDEDNTNRDELVAQAHEYVAFKKQQVDTIRDPEDNVSIQEKLEEMIARIIGKREADYPQDKGPVGINESPVGLSEPHIVSGVIGVMGTGNPDTPMRKRQITTTEEQKFIGEFDLTIIADGSGSMSQNQKTLAQKKGIIALVEAMSELTKQGEDSSLQEQLTAYTQVMHFSSQSVWTSKPSSSDFDTPQKLVTFKALDTASGTTGDFKAIEKIEAMYDSMDTQMITDIQEGKRKSIVLISTDGDSDDADRLKKAIARLRKRGVIVIGIAFGEDAGSITKNYTGSDASQGGGFPCPDVSLFPVVAVQALEPHLEKI